LRQELEILYQACPNLTELGLLDFHDDEISCQILSDKAPSNCLNLQDENAIDGLFMDLSEIRFYVGSDSNGYQNREVSAIALGIQLRLERGLPFCILTWRHDERCTKIAVSIRTLRKVYNYLGYPLGLSLDEFISLGEGSFTIQNEEDDPLFSDRCVRCGSYLASYLG
jgi:hypothetical protein